MAFWQSSLLELPVTLQPLLRKIVDDGVDVSDSFHHFQKILRGVSYDSLRPLKTILS